MVMAINYQVVLPDFQGPLDLLLNLIEDEALDITKISLAKVTDQYLAYLEVLQRLNPTELTDFLVIAARLILIKSEVLLPRPPASLASEDEEDVGEALARQLLTYKQFKQVAAQLQEVVIQNRQNFVRTAPPPKLNRLPDLQLNLNDLLAAARRAFTVEPPAANVDNVVSREVVTIGQQMAAIRDWLGHREEVTFMELLSSQPNRVELIVTLLALLELIKRQVIEVEQVTPFGNILVRRNSQPARLTEADWEELTSQRELS